MSALTHNRPLLAGAGLILAAGLGFAAARLTGPGPLAPSTQVEAPAKDAKPGTLALTSEQIAAAGVQTAMVSAGGMDSEVLASATVTAAPGGEAVVSARVSGAVTRLNRRLGDPVRAGEVLALVESQDAAAIAADRTAAQAKAILASQSVARERRLYEQRVSPRQDVERAEAELAAASAEVRRAQSAASAAHLAADGRHVAVSSPIAGRITAAPLSLGAFVDPQSELFRISDPSRIQVEAAVNADDARRLKPGDEAVIETSAGQARATVRAVAPTLNQQTRSATVVLQPGSGAVALQPGQLLRVRIRPEETTGRGGVVIPEEAVQSVGGHDAIFVRTPTGFRVQPVTVARRGSGLAEIALGPKPGETIATRNAFLLKAELGKGAEEEE